ncbi:12545_t:CDS:2 [Ambispora gerdemannii]|uniref:12545_t:CDS:1 n=1 Tax=Ambispora gerdemannii TaxID=144530 RepID=A0A9N8VK26_9GLOM|nr:12545_t:CDS:2 [Ambispora gerdemannii]
METPTSLTLVDNECGDKESKIKKERKSKTKIKNDKPRKSSSNIISKKKEKKTTLVMKELKKVQVRKNKDSLTTKKEPTFLELSSTEEKIASMFNNIKPKKDSPSPPVSAKKKTSKLQPPSQLISQLRDFLPRIASENEKLTYADPDSINVEHIEENDEQIIEWDLGLGVFEVIKESSEDDIIMDINAKQSGQSKPSITVLT